MRKFLVFFMLLSVPAVAKELTITDQKQATIQAICDVASTNPGISREIRAQIAAFCVEWDREIKQAEAPAVVKADPPPEPKK